MTLEKNVIQIMYISAYRLGEKTLVYLVENYKLNCFTLGHCSGLFFHFILIYKINQENILT